VTDQDDWKSWKRLRLWWDKRCCGLSHGPFTFRGDGKRYCFWCHAALDSKDEPIVQNGKVMRYGDDILPTITHVAYRLPEEAGGQVWSAPRPARHLAPTNAGDVTQGFLLSDGRFVDRFEGLEIALANGQLEGRTKTAPKDRLFSEDIW